LASCCPIRDIILTVAAKASGERMLFIVILFKVVVLVPDTRIWLPLD
jgi:hypothetical protein